MNGPIESGQPGQAPLVDLSECDREPIHVPGAIQPHGVMLVLDAASLRLVAHSANCKAPLLEMAARLIAPERLRALGATDGVEPLGRVHAGETSFDALAHRTHHHLIIELEPAAAEPDLAPPIYGLASRLPVALQETRSIEQLAELCAAEMKHLTGFGRALVYRFNQQGHGEVLAECRDPGYDSYVGHHFPAADIPVQARALYVLNRFRLIADANYAAVPLICLDTSLDPHGIDLSRSQLRSVSPVHLEYMRNMGTAASASVSIVVDGQLWGLISAHDRLPHRLSVGTRLACEHLGQLASLQIRATEDTRVVAERLELRKLTLEIVAHLANSDASLQHLVTERTLMLRVANATGAAVVLDDQAWTVGDTPDHEALLALADWIAGLGQEVYESHELARHYAAAAAFKSVAAGVLSISISQVHRHVILWFRPELLQRVTWAGNPSLAKVSEGRIHPRKSFVSWVQEVRDRCKPWTQAEIGAAGELRQALIGIVLRRAEELNEVATELGRANKELEAFSYTVSHDLRAPMRHIAGYVDLVLGMDDVTLSERAQRYLAHVKDAAKFAGLLVDALLDFSRLGRAALKRRSVDSNALIEGLVSEARRADADAHVQWLIEPHLPELFADPLLIQLAVRNLLTNAVKYSQRAAPPRIQVRAIHRAEGAGLEVEDNGVGFQMKYVSKLFGVFQRLHQSDEFEGTGIGLAIFKRIVERHGGTVWAHGEPGLGARFGFVLPPLGEEELSEHPDGTHHA